MAKMQRATIKEAAGLIKDGDQLTFSGFTIWRRPMALVYELVRQGKKNLHLFEVNGGTHTEVLAGAGCVKIWESCWVGHELYGKLGESIAREQCDPNSHMVIEDYSHAQVVARLLAGAMGLPHLPSALSMGTDILNPEYDMLGKAGLRDGSNPKIPKNKYVMHHDPFFDMGEIALIPAVNPDWAIIYASMASDGGIIRMNAQTYTDAEAIRAADKVMVIAEEIVPDNFMRRDPARNMAGGHMVDVLVECPWAAHPTGSQGFYDVDADFIRSFYAASKSREGYDKWAQEWIFGVADHQEYLEKIGLHNLEKLRANSVLGYSTRMKRGSR